MMKPGTTPDHAKTQASGPSSAPCLSPHNSARSAVSTACGQPITAERAEDAERAGSLNNTSRPHDGVWNEARGLEDEGCRSAALSAVSAPTRGQPITAERAERKQSHCSVAPCVRRRRAAFAHLERRRTRTSETCLPDTCDRQASLRYQRTAASPSSRHQRTPGAKLTTLQWRGGIVASPLASLGELRVMHAPSRAKA